MRASSPFLTKCLKSSRMRPRKLFLRLGPTRWSCNTSTSSSSRVMSVELLTLNSNSSFQVGLRFLLLVSVRRRCPSKSATTYGLDVPVPSLGRRLRASTTSTKSFLAIASMKSWNISQVVVCRLKE